MGIKIFLFLAIGCSALYSQIYQPPVPDRDIDSLIKSINLFEIYKRAKVEMAFKISFDINENGEVNDINYYPFFKDSLSQTDKKFIIKLFPKLKTIKWIPAKLDSNSIANNYNIPLILFTITDAEVLENYYVKKKNNSNIELDDLDYYNPMIYVNKSLFQYLHISR